MQTKISSGKLACLLWTMGSILRQSVTNYLPWPIVIPCPPFPGLARDQENSKQSFAVGWKQKEKILHHYFLSSPFCTKGTPIAKFMGFLPMIFPWLLSETYIKTYLWEKSSKRKYRFVWVSYTSTPHSKISKNASKIIKQRAVKVKQIPSGDIC